MITLPTPAARRRSSIAGHDEGFTLIELVIALTVVLVALTVLAGVFVGSLRTLTVAKERQSATALATRAMEQMRALPFSAVTSGLSTADLTGDANVTGSPARLNTLEAPLAAAELLQTNGGPVPTCATAVSPLLPHRCPKTLDGVTYTVSSYVSQVPGATPVQYSLTTVVTWTSPATRGQQKSVVNRSRAYSPNGNCTPANHPFNTPCQAQYHASAGLSEAGISVAGLVTADPIATGFDVLSAELGMPRMSTSTAVEQTVSVSGATSRLTGRIVGAGGPEVAEEQGLSSAATDPSNVVPAVISATAPPNPPLSRSGAGWAVAINPGAGTGSTVSQSAAGTASGCLDSNALAVDVTGQPCGSTTSTHGAASLVITPAVIGGRVLGPMDLATLAAPGTPSTAFGARFAAPRPIWCPTASGAGCVAAGAKRFLGDTVVGSLPVASGSDVVPAGFGGAVTLTGYQATAAVSSGVGTSAPLASRAGTLRTWNGTDYTTTDLALAPPAGPLLVSVSAIYGAVTVAITGEVAVTAPSASPAACVTTVCEASSGNVLVNLTYVFSTSSGVQASFRVTGDIGSLLTKTSYQAG